MMRAAWLPVAEAERWVGWSVHPGMFPRARTSGVTSAPEAVETAMVVPASVIWIEGVVK
jgi:hypothetical protein